VWYNAACITTLTKVSTNGKSQSSPREVARPKANSTLSAFKSLHDPTVIVPAKITAALAKLAKEDVGFAYEQTGNVQSPDSMTRRADVSTTQLAQYRQQFADHIVKVAGITGTRRPSRLVWFGDTAVAFTARGDKPANPADLE
jgi:hypothetical protein